LRKVCEKSTQREHTVMSRLTRQPPKLIWTKGSQDSRLERYYCSPGRDWPGSNDEPNMTRARADVCFPSRLLANANRRSAAIFWQGGSGSASGWKRSLAK
jgi:hypothetical protein